MDFNALKSSFLWFTVFNVQFSSGNRITWIQRQTHAWKNIHHQMYIYCSLKRWWHSFGGFMIFCIALRWKLCRQDFFCYQFFFSILFRRHIHFYFHFIVTFVAAFFQGSFVRLTFSFFSLHFSIAATQRLCLNFLSITTVMESRSKSKA